MRVKNNVILIVEDNQDDAELAILALKQSRVANEIVHVKDGSEALEYLFGEDEHPLPHVVLLDLNMPKVDGLEVLRRIRANERTRLLPVVILTTSREESDIFESYNLGVNSYIHKPVDFDQFTEAVKQLGLYWLVMNIPPPKESEG